MKTELTVQMHREFDRDGYRRGYRVTLRGPGVPKRCCFSGLHDSRSEAEITERLIRALLDGEEAAE